MTPLRSRNPKPLAPTLLLLISLTGCSGDDVVGSGPPETRPLAAAGQIVVSVFSDRPELQFTLTIDGAGTWTLRSNDDFRVEGLVPGRYLLSLKLPAVLGQAGLYCQVNQGSQRIAMVRAGETTAVRYQITCGSAPERPRDREVS